MDPKIRNQLTDEHINRAIDTWGGSYERTLLDDVMSVIYKISIKGEKKILRFTPSTHRSFEQEAPSTGCTSTSTPSADETKTVKIKTPHFPLCLDPLPWFKTINNIPHEITKTRKNVKKNCIKTFLGT